VWSLTQTTEDSTVRYERASTQLNDLREQERWLLEELGETDDPDERLELQHWLSDVRNSIRAAQSAQDLIVDAVVYSTVYVQLFEVIFPPYDYVPAPPPTFGDRLGSAVSRSAEVFVAFGQGLLLVIIAIAPVLVILTVAGAIALLVVHVVRKRGRKAKVNRGIEKPVQKEVGGIQSESKKDE